MRSPRLEKVRRINVRKAHENGAGLVRPVELVIFDDIGYVKQTTEEAEVRFTLLAERNERWSTALTSNLVFSEWDGSSRTRWRPRPRC